MITTISNSVQNLSVMQNQSSSQRSIESKPDSNEIKGAEEAQEPVKEAVGLTNSERDRDLIKFATVYTLLKDTNKVEILSTLLKDTNKLPADQVYKLVPGSIVDLLT